jgi:hypothetical protein
MHLLCLEMLLNGGSRDKLWQDQLPLRNVQRIEPALAELVAGRKFLSNQDVKRIQR